MDIYEAQNLISLLYAGKQIQFGFDDACIQTYEVNRFSGSLGTHHHIQYNKIKADIEGIDQPIYMPINPHRESKEWDEMRVILEDVMESNQG